MAESERLSPIAIVAMGAKFPGRGSTAGFWRDIVDGVDTSGDVPETHWLAEDHFHPDPSAPDKTYSARGAFIPAFPFDPVAFGTPPNVIETTDTVQLLALYVAKQVLAEARCDGMAPVDPERTSVVLGVAAGTELIGDMASRLNRPIWIKAMREEGLARSDAEAIADRISGHYSEWRESTFPGLLGNVVAGRIANRFDLGGTNFTADAACASSLAAVRHAAQELWLGESDMVLAGGADALNNIFMYMCFSKTPAMSPSGQCRPFSDDADGTLLGEGCGIFALRRLEDAERDGNSIYAVITGIGASSDGRGASVYAPRAGGQARAIRRALSAAGISPKTVELMEAHGTGTRAGDAAEFAGLKEVFGEADGSPGAWCALGSIKSQIGHTKSAAGAAGLMKVAAALHHKVLPPTIHVRAPNPKLEIEASPFYLNTKARPWVRGADHPRRASISSFGFGGTNFHMTLEEHRKPELRPARYGTRPTELFLVSASSGGALSERVREIVAECRHDDDLPHHAAASQAAFDAADSQRFACVVGSRDALAELVEKLIPRIQEGRPFSAQNAFYPTGPSSIALGKTALLFAGQGSQYVGMGADLAMAFDGARAHWDRAAGDPDLAGVRLHDLAFPPQAFTEEESAKQVAELTRTENAQPAIGLVALSHLRLLQDLQLRPDCVAGHSFGEIMALHAAGALDAAAAIRLARARGEAMACAAGTTPGGMLAVFADRGLVEGYLSEGSSGLVLANDNAPDQVILSGPVDAIERADKDLSDRGVRVRRLGVSTAFHSPLVAGAASDLRAAIDVAGLRAPELTVYANKTGEPYPEDEAAVRDLLTQQLVAPVRFRETIERMYRDGVRTFIEVGPSSVLTGLTASILKDQPHIAVALDQRHLHGVTSLQHALVKLAASGHAINFDPLWEESPAPEPRPQPKPHEVMLSGANYGKPYPPPSGSAALPELGDGPTLTELRAAASQTTGTGTAAGVPSATIEPDCESDMNDKALHQVREMHDNLAREHRRFVDNLSQSHIAFLRASEALIGQSGPDEGDLNTSTVADRSAALPASGSEDPPGDAIVHEADGEHCNATADDRVTRPVEAGRGQPKLDVPQQVDAQPTAAPADEAALSAAAETVRAVVAEKTGYPSDMLELGMDLEAELGIDSIKQVEILSALREKLPDMPEIEPARLAELRTLQLIAEAIAPGAGGGGGTPPPPVAETPAAQEVSGSAPAETLSESSASPATPVPADGAALSAAAETVRGVVAEKTGYPVDMLELGMDLEAELGIDSIKQVEILSALREKMPDMPEIEPARLAELRTLQLIAEAIVPAADGGGGTAAPPLAETQTADLMKRSDPAEAPSQPSPPPVAPLPAEGDASAAAAETVRAVVAEKTGYPADMLELGMDLEAELGIDSIKQVEILSALREKMPDMPEIEPARLAELRTLQLIAEAIVPAACRGDPLPQGTAQVKAIGSDLSLATFLDRAAEQDLFRQIVDLDVAPPSAETAAQRGKGRIEITREAQAFAGALADTLKDAGHDAQLVDEPSDQADVVVVTSGLADGCEAIEVHRSALAAARKAAVPMSQKGGRFVLLQDTGGDFGRTSADFDSAARGGLTGLAKTAAHEWPAAQLRVIDIERQDEPCAETARRIASELLRDGAPLEVGLKRNGRRLTPSVKTASYTDSASALQGGANVVVSGGGRGITAQVVRRLSALAPMRFLLLGRSELLDWPADIDPNVDECELRSVLAARAKQDGRLTSLKAISAEAARLLAAREISQTLAAVQAAGSEATYVAVDVADAPGVAAAVNAFRDQNGPVTGLIHGAGQLADKLIKDKTDEQLQRVFKPKVDGFRSLWSAVEADELSFAALFSSFAGRFGSPGQADYAMANETLNHFAWTLRQLRPQMRVMSINWGPWLGGMVNEGVRAQFEERGIPLIPAEIGVDAFVAELFHGTPEHPEIVFAGKPVSTSAGVEGQVAAAEVSAMGTKAPVHYAPSHPSAASAF